MLHRIMRGISKGPLTALILVFSLLKEKYFGQCLLYVMRA